MKIRFLPHRSKSPVGSAFARASRAERTRCDESGFGFRELVSLCSRSFLTGAVLVSSVSPSLRACIDWEHHEGVVSSWRDGESGCLETLWEAWDEGWSPSTGVSVANQENWTVESDCPPEPDPDSCPEGANPFRVYDGSVSRTVDDLAVPGAAKGKLAWSRHHNTVPIEDLCYFGRAGSWRHSWQFDLYELSATGRRRAGEVLSGYVFIYPNGISRIFRPKAGGGWASESPVPEQFAAVGDGFVVTDSADSTLRFVRKNSGDGQNRYEMQTVTDAYSAVTSLAYNARGYLTQVTEPAGRSLQINYVTKTFQKGVWRALATVGNAPAAGQWLEFTVPAELQAKQFRHLRLRTGKDSATLAVAEVQFIAPGGSIPLRGKASGTGDAAEALFDGDTSTRFVGKRASVNVVGLDLGAGAKSAVAKVRVLPAAGQESALAGVLVEALELVPTTREVIATVTGSNGLSANYDYQLLGEAGTGHEYAALTGVRYGDATRASYRYEWVTAANRPLLVDADDPRYPERAKRIRYTYHDTLGMIHQEINPATGAVYASLDVDPRDANARIVRYSDLREIRYKFVPGMGSAIAERTDSLGRTERREHDVKGRISAKVDASGHREEFTYDAKNRVQTRQRLGRMELQRERDGKGRVTREVDRQGRETRFERDANSRPTFIQHANGDSREFAYDAVGRVTSFRAKRGGQHAFTYNDRGLKATWTNPAGWVTRYTYNANDQLVTITDPIGRVARSERNERGLITKITAPDGTTRQFAYDTYGRKISGTDSQGRTTKLTYDELSRVIRQEDHAGRVTTLDYTEIPQGCSSCTLVPHPSRIVAPDGTVTAMLYDTEGQLLSRTVALGTPAQATALYAHDTDGNMTAMTDPLGRVTRFTFDDEHHRLTQTDALGRLTKWTYDDDGNVTKVVAPDGAVTKSTYDDAKRLTATTDAAGNTTRYVFDANGRLTATTNAAREVTRYTYDTASRKIATTYADGKQATTDYDSANRPAKITSPDGLVIVTNYDAGNRPLIVTRTAPGKAAETTTFTYDALGHRLTAADPLGRKTAWTYDARGNVLTVTRPDGIVGTRNTYDAQDSLLTTSDAAGAITTYTYDVARNQTSLTDARGSRYAFTYDALRRKTSMTYPDGSVEKWAYDLVSNSVAFTNRAGQTKATAYTPANQPLTETWSSSPSPLAPALTPPLPAPTAYSYNAAGRLKKVDNGNATLTYSYDELGRLASETSDLSALVPGLDPHTVGYRYDALGRRSDLVYPDKTQVSYDYDARSRLTTIDTRGGGRTPLATYAYDAQGRITQLTRDNGVVSTYTYDMARQLTNVTHANGGIVLAGSVYTLDVLGRRTRQTREDGITETYGYDITSQLASADYGAGSPLAKAAAPVNRETFAYDAVGNRTQVGRVVSNAPSESASYTANSLNQYAQVSGVRFSYDVNGNLINDGNQSYRYDAQNRLIATESINAVTGTMRAEFNYDASNRAVSRIYYTLNNTGSWVLDTKASRALTYDIAWNLLAERTLDGNQVGEYINGQRRDEVILAQLKLGDLPPTTYYPLRDALVSTVALTDESGKVTERFRYTVSGEPLRLSEKYQPSKVTTLSFRFLFTGREWLAPLGLNEHRNRYYCPSIGRWLSTDPIGHQGGVNLYAYGFNSVVNIMDPLGLCCETEEASYNAAYSAWQAAMTSLGTSLVETALAAGGVTVSLSGLGWSAITLNVVGAIISAGGVIVSGGTLWWKSGQLETATQNVSNTQSALVSAENMFLACADRNANKPSNCPCR
ncbi:MAG: RHS repeat protein [Undibacterium sp.]|nr:RHS repeat protein [Opitutaceae bacterium]